MVLCNVYDVFCAWFVGIKDFFFALYSNIWLGSHPLTPQTSLYMGHLSQGTLGDLPASTARSVRAVWRGGLHLQAVCPCSTPPATPMFQAVPAAILPSRGRRVQRSCLPPCWVPGLCASFLSLPHFSFAHAGRTDVWYKCSTDWGQE